MVCPSCLTDPSVLLVVDASVVINLNASGRSADILKAVPNRVVIPEEVSFELKNGRRNPIDDADELVTLVSGGRLEIVRLGTPGMRHFENLIAGNSADTLDDGEAATIAYALEQNGTALIDERKANRICVERFPQLRTGCTIDVLGHKAIKEALSKGDLSDAVFNALYHGRMRVLPHYIEWVVSLIGPDRAAKCHSIPRGIRTHSLPANR